MKASQYRKIAEHPLRMIFRNMVTDSRDLPSVSTLREAIGQAVPAGTDAETTEKLFQAAKALARKAATEGRDSWFDLRGEADHYVLGLVEGWEAADRLFGDDEDTAAVDVSAALDAIDGYDPTQRRTTAADHAARQAADIESAKRLA